VVTYACLSRTVNYLDTGYGLSNFIFLVFISNCFPNVLIMFGKCDTCADEEPKYKKIFFLLLERVKVAG
jgi:hypothetical protein